MTGVIIAVITTIISIFLNDNSLTENTINFSYYHNWYLIVIYSIGLIVFAYIALKIYYVVNRGYDYFGSFKSDSDMQSKINNNIIATLIRNSSIKKGFEELISRYYLYSFSFIFCYLPNNILVLVNIYNKQNMCVNNCLLQRVSIFLLSLSGFFSVLIRLRDPYIKESIYSYFQKLICGIIGRKIEVHEEVKTYLVCYILLILIKTIITINL